MVELCRRLANSVRFQNFVTLVILLAAALVGAETYPAFVERHGAFLHLLDTAVLAVFTFEIVVKMVAEGRRPWRFFNDAWNVFDFVIVVAAFLPIGSQYVTVLRLARLLRVLRLVRRFRQLQIIVSALLKSIPSMGYVGVLLLLLFYVYGVAGVFLFGKNDPLHFGDLPTAGMTLFQASTLDDWSSRFYTQLHGCANFGYEGKEALCTASEAHAVAAPLYFFSFVLLGTMVVLNLFIGVIMNGMDEARSEAAESDAEERAAKAGASRPPLDTELVQLGAKLDELKLTIEAMARRAKEQAAPPTAPCPTPSSTGPAPEPSA